MSCMEIFKTLADISLSVFTFILAIATVCLAWSTKRLADDARESSKKQIGVNTWLKLKEDFDSEFMQKERHKLAQMFQGKVEISMYNRISERLLDFFEDMGSLYEDDLIDRKLATDCFGFYVCRWWEVLKPYVAWRRKIHKDDTLFEKFEDVARVMEHKNDSFDDEEMRQFLIDEQDAWKMQATQLSGWLNHLESRIGLVEKYNIFAYYQLLEDGNVDVDRESMDKIRNIADYIGKNIGPKEAQLFFSKSNVILTPSLTQTTGGYGWEQANARQKSIDYLKHWARQLKKLIEEM
jgi:hypothetical protein